MADTGTEERSERSSKKNLTQMLAVGTVVSAILIALALSIRWFPTQASSQAGPIDTLYDVLLIVSVPVFVLVVTVVLFSVWKFRRRPGQELTDGPPIHGNTRVEVIWTAVPAVMLLALCVYAYAVLHQIEKPQKGEMVVDVTGQQFAWQFSYPPSSAGGKTVLADQLYLPKGQPIEFKLHAKDVIHSFWVPSFRMKSDTVPGVTTSYRVTPTQTGNFAIVCAELCGLGHSTMRSTVHVVEKPAFEQWLTKKGGGGAPSGGTAPPTGSSGGSQGGG